MPFGDPGLVAGELAADESVAVGLTLADDDPDPDPDPDAGAGAAAAVVPDSADVAGWELGH